MLVVIEPPGRDPNPRLSQAGKPVIVQTLVTKAAVEAFMYAFCVGLPASISLSWIPF
jgi:hypothetical protein